MKIKIDKFKPLEYYEVLEGKPLVMELGEWTITLNLWNIKTFIDFQNRYKPILKKLNEVIEHPQKENDMMKVCYFQILILLIYDCTKHNYNIFKRFSYKKYLLHALMEDSQKIIDILTLILRYNAEVKKKLQSLENFDIWQASICQTTGDIQFSDFMRTGKDGEKLLLPRFSLN